MSYGWSNEGTYTDLSGHVLPGRFWCQITASYLISAENITDADDKTFVLEKYGAAKVICFEFERRNEVSAAAEGVCKAVSFQTPAAISRSEKRQRAKKRKI